MKIDAGKLDRKLEIMTATVTKNTFGEKVTSWTVSATTWAQRLEIRSADSARAALHQTIVTARVLLRYRTGLEAGQRVRLDGTDYIVTAIDEPDRRATLILMLESVQ
ncbi:phage head closure protein [uncultured Sphingomonas sp.]|uniref:phage head closure protein n=1 Tax=uncultured Sphingomonas sp. TaxID=158754 RepID=UPI0025DC9EFD|nr:phage head closure protein [uncultured Sphingomonas sp.]